MQVNKILRKVAFVIAIPLPVAFADVWDEKTVVKTGPKLQIPAITLRSGSVTVGSPPALREWLNGAAQRIEAFSKDKVTALSIRDDHRASPFPAPSVSPAASPIAKSTQAQPVSAPAVTEESAQVPFAPPQTASELAKFTLYGILAAILVLGNFRTTRRAPR